MAIWSQRIAIMLGGVYDEKVKVETKEATKQRVNFRTYYVFTPYRGIPDVFEKTQLILSGINPVTRYRGFVTRTSINANKRSYHITQDKQTAKIRTYG